MCAAAFLTVAAVGAAQESVRGGTDKKTIPTRYVGESGGLTPPPGCRVPAPEDHVFCDSTKTTCPGQAGPYRQDDEWLQGAGGAASEVMSLMAPPRVCLDCH